MSFSQHRWRCPSCGANNMHGIAVCHACGGVPPAFAPPPSGPPPVVAAPARRRFPWWAIALGAVVLCVSPCLVCVPLAMIGGSSKPGPPREWSPGAIAAMNQGYCPVCRGRAVLPNGFQPSTKCSYCEGTGRLSSYEARFEGVSPNVQRAMEDGAKLADEIYNH
jgi:hypothetical protein